METIRKYSGHRWRLSEAPNTVLENGMVRTWSTEYLGYQWTAKQDYKHPEGWNIAFRPLNPSADPDAPKKDFDHHGKWRDKQGKTGLLRALDELVRLMDQVPDLTPPEIDCEEDTSNDPY